MDQWWQTLMTKSVDQDVLPTSGAESEGANRETDSSTKTRIKLTFDDRMQEKNNLIFATESNSETATCDIWTPTQHPLLKLCMVLMTVAFLVPPRKGSRYMVLLFRGLTSASFGVGVAWGLRVCSPDVIVWNFLFLGVNFLHFLYNLYRVVPPRLEGDAKRIYERHFQPHKVGKLSFNRLRMPAWQCELDAGHEYFSEGSRGAAQNISLLVRGRLVVSHQGSYLHDIRPLEFVDSLEWQWRDRNEDRLETRFQVTVTASEDSSLLCWHMRDMETLKSSDAFAYTVFDHVVAIDAISKLYRSIGKRRKTAFVNKSPSIRQLYASDRSEDGSMASNKKCNASTPTSASNSFLQVPNFGKR